MIRDVYGREKEKKKQNECANVRINERKNEGERAKRKITFNLKIFFYVRTKN